MNFLKLLYARFCRWLERGNAAGKALMLSVALVCGLLGGGGLIAEKLLGRSMAAWHEIAGFCVAVGTLVALYFVEEDLSGKQPTFRRRDKYFCGAAGGLLAGVLLIRFGWRPALAGVLAGLLTAGLMRWLKYVMCYV